MPPLTVQQAFDLGIQHHQAGRLAEAEQMYRQILAVEPRHSDALHLLGVIALQVGRYEDAVGLIQRSIGLNPAVSAYYSNLGEAYRLGGHLEEAIGAYHTALQLEPDCADTHNNLGTALYAQGRLEEALAAFRTALRFKPDCAEAHNNLGIALQDQGQLEAALAAYRAALRFKPDYAEAHNNLGTALKDQGQWEEALAAFRAALRFKPDYAEAHSNFGNALHAQGRLEEALAAYRAALQLKPDYAEAHNNLVTTLKAQGRLEEALDAYRAALQLKPDYTEAHSNWIYLLHFHPDYDARSIAEEHRQWNRQHAEPLRCFIQPHGNGRDPDRRLRIGYVSPDFRNHVVGRNLLPLFAQHDHLGFEIFAYAQVVSPDTWTQQFREKSDHWRGIVGRTDEQVAAQIREDQIDILVDLTLHMAHNRLRLFARKPAPLQATFAGYPGSTGLTTIDYRLSDPFLDPPGMEESIYSEQTIRLSSSFWCYDALDCRDVPVSPLQASQKGWVTFGCLNNFCKINEPVLKLWATVLRAVEGSRLLLLSPEGNHRQRTLHLLGREGISPERVEFVPSQSRRDYLKLYHRIDVGLDSFPYNGHTTSLDSFWMGVPVVTLVGQTAVSRAGWCQLSNLGLPELAGHSPEDFARIAIELANDLPRLAQLRAGLRQRMQASPLMDAPGFARAIEAAYRQMWREGCGARQAQTTLRDG